MSKYPCVVKIKMDLGDGKFEEHEMEGDRCLVQTSINGNIRTITNFEPIEISYGSDCAKNDFFYTPRNAENELRASDNSVSGSTANIIKPEDLPKT